MTVSPSPTLRSRPVVVLDTNAVFDWLVFADAGCAALGAAIALGRLRWLATPAMRDECFDVLSRGKLGRWQPNLRVLAARWAARCELVDAGPADRSSAPWPCCRDSDDQMFIDLALAHRARWLVSKDRAVLRLAGRLRVFGVEVVTPAAWAPDTGEGTPANDRTADAE